MYNASQEFHDAVANGAHQIAMMIFDQGIATNNSTTTNQRFEYNSAVFMNEDINVSTGIEFSDYFNAEEDLAIGQALSNEISFDLFNDSGLHNTFEFGDFQATIGAQISSEGASVDGRLRADSASHTYIAYDTSPYLKRDGVAFSPEPDMPIESIFIYNGIVYCLMESEIGTSFIAFKDSDMTLLPAHFSRFMVNKMLQWKGKGISYDKESRIMKICQRNGKNLANPALVTKKYINSTGGMSGTNAKYRTLTINSLPAGTYTFSTDLPACYITRTIIDNVTKLQNITAQTFTFTSTTTDKFAITIRNTSTSTISTEPNIQLEVGRNATDYEDSFTMNTYEFVPLGIFTAERPNVPYVNEIHMTCYDQMQKFEKDMVPMSELGLQPGVNNCTINALYDALCNKVGVEHVQQNLINGNALITREPDEFKNATMREVIQWIAEATGSIARFDRDGRLKMDWIHDNTDQSLDENNYSEFNRYWYETKAIDKLENRAADGSYDNVSGSGNETYLIQDNPLLKGVT